jgi:hypothetical protein
MNHKRALVLLMICSCAAMCMSPAAALTQQLKVLVLSTPGEAADRPVYGAQLRGGGVLYTNMIRSQVSSPMHLQCSASAAVALPREALICLEFRGKICATSGCYFARRCRRAAKNKKQSFRVRFPTRDSPRPYPVRPPPYLKGLLAPTFLRPRWTAWACPMRLCAWTGRRRSPSISPSCFGTPTAPRATPATLCARRGSCACSLGCLQVLGTCSSHAYGKGPGRSLGRENPSR